MIELSKKIAGFFLRTVDETFEVTTLKERYKQFRFAMLIAISIIALIPSTILAILGYYQYLNLAQQQSNIRIHWHLQHNTDQLQDFIISLKNKIRSLAQQIASNHFETPEQLKDFFKTLQHEEKQLINLDLINIQKEALLPPFQNILSQDSYVNSLWFQQALSQGIAVGVNQIKIGKPPCFIIAVRQTLKSQQAVFLLKAELDWGALEHFLQDINMNAMEDIFLIDTNGNLQSPSVYFGNRQSHFPISSPSDKTQFTTKNISWGMHKIFYATTPISGTPWILVLVKDGPVKKKDWMTFQLSLLLIFLAYAIGSFFIIHQLVKLLTIRIRESDTKRMALLNEVGHTNRLATIGKFAAGVAHEINNPLAVIDQKAGLIDDLIDFSEDFDNKKKYKDTLKGIHSSVERCKVITHRLLGFARKMDSINEILNINSIIKEVMGFLEKDALFSHITFNMQLDEDLPETWSDKGQLQQIFLNIITNSLDAIGKNGLINISTTLVKKDRILVEIKDNGPGIEPHIMEHIFDPFFTTKETGKGTGLGLSITYGLVKKLKGDIKVFSKVGEGVSFYIYLPITSAKEKGDKNG